jgi:hypothetical protein
MRFKIAVLFFLMCVSVLKLCAQKQLILLKDEKVLLRLYPGDEIMLSLNGKKEPIRSYVNNISDSSVTIHRDEIAFHTIDRIYFTRGNFLNVVGGLMVVGGAAYFVIDQFNLVVVHGEGFDIDQNVSIASASLIGVGLPLMLLKKKSQKLGGRFRLRMADKGSAFYQPDLRQDVGGGFD